MEWKPTETAPYNTPILGIILMEPNAEQLKGTRAGWLKLPNQLPFVCERTPEDKEYPEGWCLLDSYAESTDDDAATPTH